MLHLRHGAARMGRARGLFRRFWANCCTGVVAVTVTALFFVPPLCCCGTPGVDPMEVAAPIHLRCTGDANLFPPPTKLYRTGEAACTAYPTGEAACTAFCTVYLFGDDAACTASWKEYRTGEEPAGRNRPLGEVGKDGTYG